MKHFSALSPQLKALVDKYVDTPKTKQESGHTHMKLAVSLYAQSDGADDKVVRELSNYIFNLREYFSEEEIHLLLANFSRIAIHCYEQDAVYSAMGLTRSDESCCPRDYVTPKSLVALCLKLAQCKEGSDIYLPFAGTCPFALYQEERCSYDIAEIDSKSWAYSKILLYSQGISANIECRDCLVYDYGHESVIKSQKKYDFIFSFPPLLVDKDRRMVGTFLHLAKNALKDDGEMFCILPLSFCFSNSWFDMRKTLWEDHKIFSTTVIELPHKNLLMATSVALCLLWLKKDHKGGIRLLDATDESFFKKVPGVGGIVLKTNLFIETLNKADQRFVHACEIDELGHNCVNMTPSRYLVRNILPKSKNLIALGEVLDFHPKQRLGKNEKDIPVIGMKELSYDYMRCDVVPSTNYKQDSIIGAKLTDDSMLVGFINGKFKVGRTHGISQGSPVIVRHEIYAFRIKDTSVISTDFLLRALLSTNVEQQANKLATGIAITCLSLDDLKSIMIDVPSREEQNRLCTEDSRKSLSEIDRQLIETAEDYRRDVHMKKHAIGQTVFNLSNWWRVLQKVRHEHDGVISDADTVGRVNKTVVSDIYENIQNTLTRLQQQVQRFDVGYGMIVEDIPLTTFIENYIATHRSPIFQFIYDKTPHHAAQNLPEVIYDDKSGAYRTTGDNILEQGDALEYASFAPEALEKVFNNIISNACFHGFEGLGRNTSENLIRISLSSEGTDYIITISNNGRCIDHRLTIDEVFVYGRSSHNGKDHFGIGGYEIKKLMREFNGDAELIQEAGAEFPVTYKLTFHKTNI